LRTKPAVTAAADLPDDAYRLLSIQHGGAPSGSAGRDWYTYRISQGPNMITGYRRGSLESVTVEVDQIVVGLNERRVVRRGRVDLTPSRPSTPPAPASKDSTL